MKLTFFLGIRVDDRLCSWLGACRVKVSHNAILFGASTSNLSPFQGRLVHSTLPEDEDLVRVQLVEGRVVL